MICNSDFRVSFKYLLDCVFFRIFPFILIYSVIFYLSGKRVSELPTDIPDIIPHFIEYFVLSFSFMRIIRSNKKRNIIFALIFLMILAISDEFHQIFIPTRCFSIKDIFIDLTGILTGFFAYLNTKLKFLL
jgi:VanZ family protein